VLEKETKVSKGVGVVVFAMREDAIQCVEKGTMDMNGRTLRVDWAGAKVLYLLFLRLGKLESDTVCLQPRPGEDSPKKSQSPVKRPNPISPNPTKSKDPDAIRTITITGLPKDIDSKVLWKKVRKQPGAESIKYPAILADGSEDATQAFVIFASPSQATNAVEKLNAHVYKGAVIGVTLKKRLEARPNRSSRLIIRNLPWGATEADLRTLFLPYGPIYSVEIPTDANPNPTENGDDGKAKMKPKAKGFAFVWMLTKADAEKAVEGANGTTLKARVIAVDWALSKSKWQDIKDQMKEDQPPEDVSESLDDGSSSSGHSQEEEEKDGLGVHSAEDVSMHSASSDESDNEDREEPIKPELPAPEAGTKLFIRNVPWEATEDELQQL
jgi:nucleolar protein 4